MITVNVLQRTFHIKYGNGTGTAFTIDVEGKQYLITAKHVIEGFNGGPIEIFHDGEWKNINCDLIGHGEGKVDVSVLAPPVQLSPTHPLNANMAGLVIGQQVYFLGFPFGQMMNATNEFNRDFPFPLIKSCIVCGVEFENAGSIIYLDGINNKGFSGGPVVFVPPGRPANDLYVAGIVVSTQYLTEPVFDQDGHKTGHYVNSNTGIMKVFGIKCAKDLIEQNPSGFVLPRD